MRNLVLIITTLISLECFSQSAVKYIYADSKLPAKEIYSTILVNGKMFNNCFASDSNGYATLRIYNVDSTSKYYFTVDSYKYKPIWKEINRKQKDTITVLIVKNNIRINASELIYFSGGVSSPSYLGYHPKKITGFADLPECVSVKIKNHLRKRVGEKYYKQMKLISGEEIDLNFLNSIYPYWKDSKTTYRLCFSYSNVNVGIGMYASSIELDKNGDVVEEIEFPYVQKKTIQEKLVSFEAIKKKSKMDGVYIPNITKIKMTFDASSNLLIWVFSNKIDNHDHTIIEKEYIYNAHDGSFIKENTITWSVS